MASLALRLTSRVRVTKRSILSLTSQKTWRQTQYLISTSKKKDETAITTSMETVQGEETPEEQFPSDASHDKNWISFGYDNFDRDNDRWLHNMVTFMTVTVCLIGGGVFLAYLPDHKLQSWSQREAYLELERRERLGLPRIDANLIPPDKIVLPTEEELGDTEIVI